jgi:hypothetical protein
MAVNQPLLAASESSPIPGLPEATRCSRADEPKLHPETGNPCAWPFALSWQFVFVAYNTHNKASKLDAGQLLSPVV